MATTTSDVAHLLRRSGFGGTAARVAQLVPLDRPALVDAVLDIAANPADALPPELADPAKGKYEQFLAMLHQWYDRMATSPTPVVEKMTLFLHGHFTTQSSEVYLPKVIREQISFYRANALGNFRTLVDGMALQPAMLLYLDNASNNKRVPNQNFARELLELFTLGVGNYTETDVIEAARAWTGFTANTDWDAGVSTYVFRADWHDTGNKTFMGTTKNFDGPAIIAELFANPTTAAIMAKFIVSKLWRFFASPTIPVGVADALAKVFVDSNWELKPVLRALFLRPEFWTPETKLGLVRSPAEWIVAAIRGTGLSSKALNPQWHHADMGQELYNPPNVAGWKTNEYWISTSAAGARANFADNVAYALDKNKLLVDSVSKPPDQAVQAVLDQFQVLSPAPRTVEVLNAWIAAQRAAQFQAWAEPGNLVRLVLLAPDLQMA